MREEEEGNTPKKGRTAVISAVDKDCLKRWIDDNAFRGIGKAFDDIRDEIHKYQKAFSVRNGGNSSHLKLACDATIYNILGKFGLLIAI